MIESKASKTLRTDGIFDGLQYGYVVKAVCVGRGKAKSCLWSRSLGLPRSVFYV